MREKHSNGMHSNVIVIIVRSVCLLVLEVVQADGYNRPTSAGRHSAHPAGQASLLFLSSWNHLCLLVDPVKLGRLPALDFFGGEPQSNLLLGALNRI